MANDMEPATVLPPIADAPPDIQEVLRTIGKRPPAAPRPQTAKDIPSIVERAKAAHVLNGNGKHVE